MRTALGMLTLLAACSPSEHARGLPGMLVDIPIAPGTQLNPDCTYWNGVEHTMSHPPDGAACVTMRTEAARDAVAAYDASLTQAHWRKIDELHNNRLYEKTDPHGCAQRFDFTLYPATAPSGDGEGSPNSVLLFIPHPNPCAGHA